MNRQLNGKTRPHGKPVNPGRFHRGRIRSFIVRLCCDGIPALRADSLRLSPERFAFKSIHRIGRKVRFNTESGTTDVPDSLNLNKFPSAGWSHPTGIRFKKAILEDLGSSRRS
ncbi:hypothetical protein [Pseudochelatococcus contaminans]|uniref:Uncharacterized protein n=1 Tax=Pseudochelatococcus contaminans TaxID=1538103 RepID=A0A7W5Z7N6_9HYPH|nr:hypothetical protein [Pseudochelatococcus contaminans]MBB3811006.1 hypothetical protein [Pseudochelatococcus contaminans]